MKKYVLMLLCAVVFMSCTKEIIEAPRRGSDIATVKKDTTKKVDTVKKDTTTKISSNLITVNVVADPNNSDHVVQGNVSSELYNVTVANVDLTVKGLSGTLEALPVHVTVTNNGTGAANTAVTELRLYDTNGVQLDSELVPPGDNPQVIFRNMNLAMAGGTTGSTIVLTIKADIAPIDGTIVATGFGAQVRITSNDVSQMVVVNGGSVFTPASNLSGSAIGPNVYFYVNGINVTANGSATNTYSIINSNTQHGVFGMTIPFAVTAFGKSYYVPSVPSLVTDGTPDNPSIIAGPNIQYIVENGALLAGATATITYVGTDKLTFDANGNYQIPVGQTKNFVLQITYASIAPGSYQARLVNVNSNADDSATSYTMFTGGLILGKLCTPYVAGQ